MARGITEQQVKAASLQKDGASSLSKVEEFLGGLIRAVEPASSNGGALKAVAGLLCRAGQLLLRPGRSSGVDCEDVAKAELKFRKELSDSGVGSLPPCAAQGDHGHACPGR